RSRRSDHDSVGNSLSRMSTVARIQVRSPCFRMSDHDSATRGLEALTMTLRLRSTPDCAFDHDFTALCGAAERELRSAGSACFRDHCSPVKTAPSPSATLREWRALQGCVNDNSALLEILVQNGFVYR